MTRIVAPGEREVLGDSPDRGVEVLTDHLPVHATWARFAARREGAPLHVHHEHTDYFYVLEGELEVRLGPDGAPHRVEAGQLSAAPPLVVHGFANTSDAEVRFLNFHIPGSGFIDFMRGMRDGKSVAYDQHDPPADGGRDPADASVGPPRKPFALIELESGEQLEAPEGRPTRSAYLISGELEAAGAGSWIYLDQPIAATASATLLVLDMDAV